jgi:hypothetical protein
MHPVLFAQATNPQSLRRLLDAAESACGWTIEDMLSLAPSPLSHLELAERFAPVQLAAWSAADEGLVAAADTADVFGSYDPEEHGSRVDHALAAIWQALEAQRGEVLAEARQRIVAFCKARNVDPKAALAVLEGVLCPARTATPSWSTPRRSPRTTCPQAAGFVAGTVAPGSTG